MYKDKDMASGNFTKTSVKIFAGITILGVWLCAVSLYHTHKPLPDGLEYSGGMLTVGEDDFAFLYDLTAVGPDGERLVEQQIFDTIFETIANARRYILIDMFLFNACGTEPAVHRNLSHELAQRLIEQKKAVPALEIDFITDPINTVYGGTISPEIEQLRRAGINVIVTDLHRIRDSNFLYSAFWRTFLQWYESGPENGWLPHPFSGQGDVTLAGYLDLVNFKANHRKVIVADSGDQMVTMITSANPHGGSSAHGNVAVAVRGDLWRDVYRTESAVAKMSGGSLATVDVLDRGGRQEGSIRLKLLTEKRIKQSILAACKNLGENDAIRLAMFYLADRDIVRALLDAAEQGASVRLILDPNRDAFGYEKNGIPNRQVGEELVEASAGRIQVRWYDTHGEQFHPKLFVRENVDMMTMITGSANLTRRNLDNFNLEIDVYAEIDKPSPAADAVHTYFERMWLNSDGNYTVEFETYRDTSKVKYLLYRIQERLGLGTF